MTTPDLIYFEELKNELVLAFRKTHPHCAEKINEWKGQEISDFQEELMNKVKGRISEKWFYTHIKSPTEKLPRIDMLNMLSEYAGYKNWSDFVGTKQNIVLHDRVSENQKEASQEKKSTKRSSLPKYVMVFAGIAILAFVVKLLLSQTMYIYKFHFVDIDGNTPVKNKIRVIILRDGESPVFAQTNAEGVLEVNEQSKKLKFVISTPYFRPDTFVRVLNKDELEEKLRLRTDDYALMIHYFSKSNIKDWEKRRAQLDNMITENAKIFQVYSNDNGMELFNKGEFIDKMTMPLKSLRDIQILDVEYSGNKIATLRFTQLDKNEK